MDRATFLLAYGLFLKAHGIRHFRAYEGADVGRVKKDEEGHVLAVLRAPPVELWVDSIALWEVWEWIRDRCGGRSVGINSCFRDPDYNRAVGGKSHSVHRLMIAGDGVIKGLSPVQVAKAAAAHPNADRLGIGVYRTFTHVDVRGVVGVDDPAVQWPARWGVGPQWW